MTRPQVVVLSRRGRQSLDERSWSRIERSADVTVVQRDHPPDPRESVALLAGADLVASTNACLSVLGPALLDALPRLRGIVLYATGQDHLDVPQLSERGIGLSVVPEYATTAVAEHAVAMLLALATRLHLANDRSRGLARPEVSLRGVEVSGRTLGVVGVGRIGTEVCRMARAFGMAVQGNDIDPAAVERARGLWMPIRPLSELLTDSDVVVLSASHRFRAGPLLGAAELSLMRPGALLVNVGRSGLVDTAAVVEAVRAGRLRGYAVDDTVLDPLCDQDLLSQGRVLQTGHSAWWRDEVLDRGALMWGERVLAAVEGRPLDAVTWPVRTSDVRDSPRRVTAVAAR